MHSLRILARSRSLIVITALVLGAATHASMEGRRNDKFPTIAIENFGQINEQYYRGAQPKGSDYANLAALGVKTVIDLTRDGEEAEEQLANQVGMKFFRIPLTTTAAPGTAAVDRFLSLVNNPEHQPVYVHCQGGRHRTGIMTALYRLTHDGWTADRAFAEMRQYEFDKGFGHGALKNFLFDFYSTLAPTSAAVR
jgi:protein tyrosine/serine phosphatase